MGVENVGWLLSLIGIIGAIINIKKKKICFIIWSFGNIGWIFLSFWIPTIRPQIPLWLVFTILNCYGWWMWRKEEKKAEEK